MRFLSVYITGHLSIYRLSIGNFLPFMDRSYILYILIYIIFHFKHDVLITEMSLRGVFNKVFNLIKSLKISNNFLESTIGNNNNH